MHKHTQWQQKHQAKNHIYIFFHNRVFLLSTVSPEHVALQDTDRCVSSSGQALSSAPWEWRYKPWNACAIYEDDEGRNTYQLKTAAPGGLVEGPLMHGDAWNTTGVREEEMDESGGGRGGVWRGDEGFRLLLFTPARSVRNPLCALIPQTGQRGWGGEEGEGRGGGHKHTLSHLKRGANKLKNERQKIYMYVLNTWPWWRAWAGELGDRVLTSVRWHDVETWSKFILIHTQARFKVWGWQYFAAFLKEMSYVHKGRIYLITNTVQ